MTFPDEWMDCLRTIGLLSLELSVISGVALGLERFARAPRWQRAIWQGAVVAMIAIIVFEVTGLAREAAAWSRSWAKHRPYPGESVKLASAIAHSLESREVTPAFRLRVLKQLALHRLQAEVPQTSETYLQGRAMPWPELIWLFGTCAVLAPMGLARLLFFWLRIRSRTITHEGLIARLARTCQSLGLRRPVRVFESPRLRAPVACGILFPAIGLPLDFVAQFSDGQQEAMLAHELAHLAGWDPAWQLAADLMAAQAWWHPLGWWARYRLRSASEVVADEASTVIPDGTNLLAECLLRVATQLRPGRSAGWLGITGGGFRSALGRRVERLVRHSGAGWLPFRGAQGGVVRIVTPLAFVILAIAATAWSGPQKTGEPMKAIQQTWKRSVATLALFAAMGPDPVNARENAAIATLVVDNPAAAASVKPGADASLVGVPGGAGELTRDQTLVQDGRMLLEMGKLEEAEAKLRRVLAEHPNDPNAEHVLGMVKEARTSGAYSRRLEADSESKAALAKPSLASESPRAVETNNLNAEPGKVGARPQTPEQRLSAVSRYQMDPALAARYGLMPKREAAAPVTKLARADEATPTIAPEEEPAPPPAPQYRMDPRLMRRYGLMPPAAANQADPAAPGNRVAVNRGHQQVENKLNQIIFNEVVYDGISLGDVLKDLQNQARKRDPAKQGLNFLMSNVSDSSARPTGIDPTTGTPISPPVLDLGQVSIRLHLQDVRLKDVLDAMTRVADQPIKYSVEDYGIVFSPGAGPMMAAVVAPSKPAQETSRLLVRTFRVDTNTFWAGLEGAFGIAVHRERDQAASNLAEKAAQIRLAKANDDYKRLAQLREQGTVSAEEFSKVKTDLDLAKVEVEAAHAKGQNQPGGARDVQQALRQLLQQLGVNMEVPNKAVFYNELTGIVMVRATPDDLELVQAAIETLGGKALRQGSFQESQNSPSSALSSSVSIVGTVNRQGAIDLPAEQKIDLLEGIARAGGFGPTANKNKIELLRRGQSTVYRFDDLKKGTMANKIWLEAGDHVFVHASFF